MTALQMLETAEIRRGLSRALKYVRGGDHAAAIELLRGMAAKLQDEGWRVLALELQLVAAELGNEDVAAAIQHWYWCWGYLAGVEHMQRQR